MPTTFGDGLMLGWADDMPRSLEPFDIGSVGVPSVEPFDIVGVAAHLTSVEPFWMYGAAAFTSVEPFDSGEKLTVRWAEPFDILGPTDQLLNPVDLGDGDLVEAEAAPIYGFWLPDTDEYEDLGPMATD